MNVGAAAELVEENERLKGRLKEYKDDAVFKQKASDFATVAVGAVLYFLAVHFILDFAWSGIIYTIYVQPNVNIFMLIVTFLTCKVFLFLVGGFATIWAMINIYNEDIVGFIYSVSSAIVRRVDESKCDDEFEYIDDGLTQCLEDEIKRDLTANGISPCEKRSPVKRTAGKFIRDSLGRFARKD